MSLCVPLSKGTLGSHTARAAPVHRCARCRSIPPPDALDPRRLENAPLSPPCARPFLDLGFLCRDIKAESLAQIFFLLHDARGFLFQRARKGLLLLGRRCNQLLGASSAGAALAPPKSLLVIALAARANFSRIVSALSAVAAAAGDGAAAAACSARASAAVAVKSGAIVARISAAVIGRTGPISCRGDGTSRRRGGRRCAPFAGRAACTSRAVLRATNSSALSRCRVSAT